MFRIKKASNMALGRLIILWVIACSAFLGAFFGWGMSFWASVGMFYLAGFGALAVMLGLFLFAEVRSPEVQKTSYREKQTA